MNDYYNGPAGTISPFTRAKAQDVAGQLQAIAAAFDLLPDPGVLSGNRGSFAVDQGAANMVAITLPGITAYQNGIFARVEIAAANTGPATITLNGIASVPLVDRVGAPLNAGDLQPGQLVDVTYLDGSFRLSTILSVSAASIRAAIGYTPANLAGADFTGALSAPNVTSTGGSVVAAGMVSKGGQFVLGYKGNTAIRSEVAGTVNIDLDLNSVFRIYRRRADNSVQFIMSAPETSQQVTFYQTPLVNGQTMWHAGNDGAGSGLDADLLDGQEGSYYAKATDLAGKASLSGATFTGILQTGGTGLGGVSIQPGTSNTTGVAGFYTSNGDLQGYIGGGGLTGTMYYAAHGGGHVFTSGPLKIDAVMSAGPIQRDTQFYMELDINGSPFVNFDANSYIKYDRANKKYIWIINNRGVASLDSNGNLIIAGSITQNANV